VNVRGCVTVLVSFEREIEVFLHRLKDVRFDRTGKQSFFRGDLHGLEVLVSVTGSGRSHLEESLLEGSRIVVSAGICGAMAPTLSCGDIVTADRVYFLDTAAGETAVSGLAPGTLQYHDIPESRVAFDILTQKHGSVQINVVHAATVTVEKPILHPEEKSKVREKTGVVSVDMEDFFRCALIRRLGIPFVSIRAVYDDAFCDAELLYYRLDSRRLSIAAESIANSIWAVVRGAGNFA
jgi:nucleoside phosphorylase